MHLPPDLARGTLRTVLDIVMPIGERLLAMPRSALHAQAKPGGIDLVTAADDLSERLLCEAIGRAFPDHGIIAEEGGARGRADSPWTWHIDPLDGTANFSRGIPYWSLSVGLAYEQQPVLGVVHGPACGLTVSGGNGIGAWSHAEPLPNASPAGDPATWIIACDWPWQIPERQRSLAFLGHLAPRIRQCKAFGSAALDLAQVACGRIDAYAISHIFTWDQCAGTAILAALGYDLRTWRDEAWDLGNRDLVAMRPGMRPLLSQACRAASP
jgi:myo-inositol-1(or 4)-monophosphatase